MSFKKSAPVLLLGTMLIAAPATCLAQGKGGTSVVPTAGSSGKVSIDSLIQRYLTLAGSQSNAQSLVNGLRDGTEISLAGTIQEQVQIPVQTEVAETIMIPIQIPAPPPAPPGTFITILQPQTITRTVTTYKTETITRNMSISFMPPTENMGLGNVDIALALTEAVLTQQNAMAPTPDQLQIALMDSSSGILQMRARKMGWGDIAKVLGFEVK